MAILTYAVLIFYAEQIYEVETNKFESIAVSLWWAIVVTYNLIRIQFLL
jgi:hypothetical protein